MAEAGPKRGRRRLFLLLGVLFLALVALRFGLRITDYQASEVLRSQSAGER